MPLIRTPRAALFCAIITALTVPVAASNLRNLDRANLDTSTAACSDFYQYANGSWIKANPVPPEHSSWGLAAELRERNEALLHEILIESANSRAAEHTNVRKVGNFFASAMDEDAIEKAGISPIREDLADIEQLASAADIMALVARWHREGIPALFGFGGMADLKNSTATIGYAVQAGLGLPERDYYLREDAESVELRNKYLAHMQRMFELSGVDAKDAKSQAAWVLELETTLARASMDKVAMRDPANYYNIRKISEVDAETPSIGWRLYFDRLGLNAMETFSFAQPQFFTEIDHQLTRLPIGHWKAYMRWNLLSYAAPYLNRELVEQDFAFRGKTLAGTEELRPRWKRVLEVISNGMGEALGEVYVARAFPPEAKTQALQLVENLRQALRTRLESLEWMSEETRRQALVKLATFTPKIGYPDRWRDYSGLGIEKRHYLDNVRAAGRFEAQFELAKIGKPVDRAEWRMTPQTINAYYNPLQNEIVFPAAILQPPFFDPEADAPLNYGAIGAVIGHELLHGFDDKGSKFDEAGNMRNWWTDEDRSLFDARTAKLVQQFDGYVAIDDLKVNGKLTLGENIADLGGLTIAYDALKLALGKESQDRIDGFSPEQRFFLSWAQAWRRNYRDEALKLQVNTDPHSPAKFRTNGPVSNMPAFAEAFGCKQGDPMVRDQDARVSIW
jgi:putative endopeptidase